MISEQPIPLTFPVSFPDIPSHLFMLKIPRAAVTKYLGPPMLTDTVEGLGDADFWGFEYPCGLKVVFEFLHASDRGRVVADSPELQHVLRHLPVPSEFCEPIAPLQFQSEISNLLSVYPDRKNEIGQLRAFQVWRQGTDGNPFTIGDPTSERDAACWVRHFESLGHHQHYWYSKVSAP